MLKKTTFIAVLIVILLISCEITFVSVRGDENSVHTEENEKADSINAKFILRNK